MKTRRRTAIIKRCQRWLLAALLPLAGSGCGTILTYAGYGYTNPPPYEGVKYDFRERRARLSEDFPWWSHLYLLDAPCSFVADTLLLPCANWHWRAAAEAPPRDAHLPPDLADPMVVGGAASPYAPVPFSAPPPVAATVR